MHFGTCSRYANRFSDPDPHSVASFLSFESLGWNPAKLTVLETLLKKLNLQRAPGTLAMQLHG